MKNQIIETERLRLRPMAVEDADLILELYNSPNYIKYIGDRNIKSIRDAEDYITYKFLPQHQRLGYGNYLISLKENGAKIGGVGIFQREGLDIHDIGFSFLPQFEGKGYGFEAASKLLKVGFLDFGLKKVSAITLEENLPSRKLIEKLGLKYIKKVKLPDDEEELMYYEIENPY